MLEALQRMFRSRVFWAIASPIAIIGSLLGAYLYLGDSPRAYADLVPSIDNPIWTWSTIVAFIGAIVFTILDRITVTDETMLPQQRQRWRERHTNRRHKRREVQQHYTSQSTYGYGQELDADTNPEPKKTRIPRTKVSGKTSFKMGVIAFLSLFLVHMFWLYVEQPSLNGFGLWGYIARALLLVAIIYGLIGLKLLRLSATPVFGVVLTIVISLVSMGYNTWWIGENNAKMLAKLADVTVSTNSYPATDEKTIPVFGPQEARSKADRAMNDGGLGTFYDLGECVEQKVKGKRTYVCGLYIPDRRTTQTTDFDVTAYVTVDPSEKDAIGVPVRKTDDGNEIHIAYWPGGWTDANLERLVWKSYPGYYVDDYTFEIDDTGRPYYTATLNKPPLRFEQAMPEKLITVDAQTGGITPYALDNIPSWVDRVYSRDTVMKLMDWWGEWGQAPYNYFGNSKDNRYKVNGHMNLVFTNEGGMAWQVLMSSWRNDKVIQYVVLFNTRGDLVTAYPAPRGLVTEDAIIGFFKDSTKNIRKHEPTNLGLYRVYGESIWIGSMVKEGTSDNDDEGYPTPASYAATGIMRASKSEANNAIIGTSPQDAFDQLSVQIATQPLTDGPPNPDAQKAEVTGFIDRVNIYSDPNTGSVLVLRLNSIGKSDEHIYRGRISYDQAAEFVLLQPGDTVKITFLDTGKTERAIATITTLSLATK